MNPLSVLRQHAVTQLECCLEYLSSYPMGFKNYQMVQQQQKNWHTGLIQGVNKYMDSDCLNNYCLFFVPTF